MGYGISFGEPAVHLESMCGSSSSTVLEAISNCVHFEEGCGPSLEIPENTSGGACNALTEFDATSFSKEKAGPIMAVVNAVLETDYTAVLKQETGQDQVVSHAEMSCTEIDSAIVAIEKYNPIVGNCVHFEEGCGPSSDISENISGGCNALTEFDATSFSQQKAGPIMEVVNAVMETDYTAVLKEKTGQDQVVIHAEMSCAEIDSAMVALEKYNLVEVLGTVTPGSNEGLLPPLVNGSGISIDNREDVNVDKCVNVTTISKDDASLANAFSSGPSAVRGAGFVRGTPGIDRDSSLNACEDVDSTIVLEEKVGLIEGAGFNPSGLVLARVDVANTDVSSQTEGTNPSTAELTCNVEMVALANTPKERERKPESSELIVFTRRNPKRSATHAESDLNIDRLTRISNRSRKSKKDKETFDPTLLVRMIQDPNLNTKKRKPLNRREKVPPWGKFDNLSQIMDLSLEFCQLKQEREAEEKKQKIAPLEKMDRKCKISDQFVEDLKHLKQEGILDRDMDSTLTHEISSVGHENVRRATNERDTTDPGSSPDSVVYNPLSCEANPVEQQQKRLTRTKKKKKSKGENAKHGGRDGPLTVSGNANQGTLYWFQIDKKGRPFSNGKREEKDQDLSAPEVTRKEMGNMPDPYNGVTIASLSGFSINGTQEPFRYGGFMAQLLPAAKPLVPVEPVASCSVPVPVPSNTGSGSIAEQPVHVPVMPGQHLPVHMQSISSSLRPLHMPTNPAAAVERTLQVDAQPAPAQSVSASGKPAPKPRVAWVCCDECGKWRCISAELADFIDETNCRWTCKDNADKVFADCSIPQEKSNAEINAELELTDASGDEGQSHRGSKIEDAKHMKPLVRDMSPHSTKLAKKALGPAPYTPLKTNFFLHRHRRSQTIDEIMVCNCKPPENGGAGCRSQCLNRMLSIECIKGMCPCGDLCSNQQFQRRNYAKLISLRCGKKGYGLQLLEDVRAGRFLIEYVGEVLDMATYEARQKEYASIGKKHFYFMTLDGGEVIDACAKGNLGRFINHSCDPNCRTEKWIVNGEVCIGLFAVRDIKKGEELTFDYNYVRVVGAAAKKCFCGAANCRGYIGGDPSSTELVVHEDSDEEDYFEPVTAKELARKESIHRAATVATLSDNTPKKHPQPGKSQDIFGMSTPVVQRTDSVKVHKLGSKEHLAGCKPDSAVSRLASSLVNGPTDKALAVPANSLQAFGHSQSNIYPENAFQSKIREKSTRHKTDAILVKPSDSQGTSGSVNGDGLSRAVISVGDPFETAKPENSHGFCEPLDNVADKSANIKDISRPSSFSNIAVSSYSLLELHLSRVNSLGEFKMENIHGLSQPPDTSLLINSVERKPLEQENLQNNSCDTSTNNREADDVSTPVLPDHSMEEQVPVDTDADNLWKSSCVLISSSDGYAQTSLAVPEHLNLPIEDTPSEEDAPRTPVHVTRFISNRVLSRQSGHKTSSYNEPSVSDVPTEHVDLYLKNPDEHDRSMSPPVGTSGMKNVSTGMAGEDLAMYQEVKEMAHTAACDFEGVEEKLDKLLDEGGSINRRRHATKGYLKLLIVTAAAGDTGTSQRLRDLSLILDALLKTSNSYVLMDIMKTNGLQMLHTILKQNRDDFTRIPIIRKLLKVLGHLADRGILTLEQMNQGPPRPGMESFRESIYKLTKHKDKQVHHNARAFFDKYMPKYMRVHDSFSHSCNPSTSKRKSRWDCPSDSHNQESSFHSYNSQAQHLERPTKRPCSENMEEDVPPGFEPVGPPPGFETDSPPGFKSVSPPGFGSLLQPALGSGLDIPPVQVALGYRQESYRPGVSVSYGIPAVAAQTLGVFVQSGETVCWGIAPSIPFQLFPPLPPNATIGNNNVGNNGPGFRNDRARRRWNSNSKNQRRFSRPWNNNNYARNNSNGQRSCKDWPKWPRERR